MIAFNVLLDTLQAISGRKLVTEGTEWTGRGNITQSATQMRQPKCQKLVSFHTGVARIFSGVHFSSSPRSWRPFISRRLTLKTHAKTTKLTTSTVQIFPIASKNGFLLCLGVHVKLSSVNLAQHFFTTLGVHVHPVHPLATPMLSLVSPSFPFLSFWSLQLPCEQKQCL